MGAFLLKAAELLRETFPPWRFIDSDQQGVRFTRGKVSKKPLQPGMHWFIPHFQRIEAITVVYQEMDCDVQRIETTDRKRVNLSCNIGYEITNAVKMRTMVEDLHNTLERAARVHIFNAVHNSDYETIRKRLQTLSKETRSAIQRQTGLWGVRVKRVGFTDFTEAKQYSIFGLGGMFGGM